MAQKHLAKTGARLDEEKEEPIVDIASGWGFTLVVTKSGLVWAWGNKFLDALGQNS